VLAAIGNYDLNSKADKIIYAAAGSYGIIDNKPGQKVGDGKLGMKTGEGFRRWTPETAGAVRERLSRFLVQQAKARRKSRV